MTDMPTETPTETPTGSQQLKTPPSTSQDVINQQASSQDYVILRIAVVGLTVIALASILGSLYIINNSKGNLPDGLVAVIALAGAAVGGLVTMLTRVPLSPNPTPPKTSILSDRRKE